MAIGVDRVNTQLGIVFDFSLWSVDFADGKTKRNHTVLAPFYGQVFAAEFIGSSLGEDVQVIELAITGDGDGNTGSGALSAYVAYESGRPARVAVINMQCWSGMANCSSSESLSRPSQEVEVSVPKDVKSALVEKLTSPCGADAFADQGITWDGVSWNTAENDGIGRQVLDRDDDSVANVTIVNNGTVNVRVGASEAVMVNLGY
ncbi:uncharacterized protein A1O5_05242 [Cladophialophora psammophila CBS 110553]|uniref:Beta-glucuronidase C-terminal domain-containing protein n=1 Tax=Cladophialophora psammophila CBS 110553 TaxID=1182543 RepID=W9XM68_9EURO|nr:uncharacterized protein A1O5_05242 [Cladophialophora psammophila CBS 110553]EXJ71434.1 hypothetical protein A1O5_05242 [Cladophialophora psammophila CBS 110553]